MGAGALRMGAGPSVRNADFQESCARAHRGALLSREELPASSQCGLISPQPNLGDDPCPRTRQLVIPETP